MLSVQQNVPGVDIKLRRATIPDTQYFLSDHLGSTNGLTNSSGIFTASNSYDSFGNATNSGFPTRYQYTGRELDSFTGLQYNRARFYDPDLGRFISEDPIGFLGRSVNWFRYVGNDPISSKDPTGEGIYDIVDNGVTTIYYYYYNAMCVKEGVKCQACHQNDFNEDPVKWMEKQFENSPDGSHVSPYLGNQFFHECFGTNYYCQKAIEYAADLAGAGFPLNPEKAVEDAYGDYKKNIKPNDIR